MTRAERIAQWARWYEASSPDYRPWALLAVWNNERELFADVTKRLHLSLEKLMRDMTT
jgi:hypothetical protein